jgi:hypothetical protein
MIVSDLQGKHLILSDPVIHTMNSIDFHIDDGSNLGKGGIGAFFSVDNSFHPKCNDLCRELGL